MRIAVNGEFDEESAVLKSGFERLKSGGRMSVITFHSTEDRLVKQCFAGYCEGCTCPPDFPQCVCGKKPLGHCVNTKPILPSQAEMLANNRAHSAKLRIFERTSG